MVTLGGLARALACAGALAIALVLPADRSTHGQELMRIAAVVNDEIVSIYDLGARIAIVIASSNLPDSPELRRQVAPQVLRSLVDERLQAQEAARLDVSVGDDEMGAAIRTLEERNNLPPGGLGNFIRSKRLDQSAVMEQIQAELLWSKIVTRRLAATVSVGEDEIDDALSRLEANRGLPEYRIAEIFLAVETPDVEREVAQTARGLVQQIRGGARFPAIARQFSQSATAAVGGDIGWVIQGQLPPELDSVIQSLERGNVSDPIRAFDGFYILWLVDRRTVLTADPLTTRVRLAQLVVEAGDTAGEDLSAFAARIGSGVRGCEALLAQAATLGSTLSGELGEVAMKDLPEPIRDAIGTLPVGQASAPLPFDQHVRLLMVCGRDEAETRLPDRDAVRNGIAGRRLEMLARRYLRDLRRAAFVEYRI